MEVIDLNEFQYKGSWEKKPSKTCAKPSQKGHSKRFLASIPFEWVSRAATLPGRTLHAALALRHLSALQKTATVKMQRKIREELGLSSETYNEALIKLEIAGLVKVKRVNGQAHTVTIIEVEGLGGIDLRLPTAGLW